MSLSTTKTTPHCQMLVFPPRILSFFLYSGYRLPRMAQVLPILNRTVSCELVSDIVSSYLQQDQGPNRVPLCAIVYQHVHEPNTITKCAVVPQLNQGTNTVPLCAVVPSTSRDPIQPHYMPGTDISQRLLALSFQWTRCFGNLKSFQSRLTIEQILIYFSGLVFFLNFIHTGQDGIYLSMKNCSMLS